MDEYQSAKIAGAKIFRLAIKYVRQYGWDHNSMEILLRVSEGETWPQPMAVLMFSELSNALGAKTLSKFDESATPKSVIELFEQVATQLTTSN